MENNLNWNKVNLGQVRSSVNGYTNVQLTANEPLSLTDNNGDITLSYDTTVLDTHLNNDNNPHRVTKSQVGLSNVDNTSDLYKPISIATQSELDTKLNSSVYNQYSYPVIENGDLITFNDEGNRPLHAVMNIEPVQAGSGDPYPQGGGKNQLDISNATIGVDKGITFSFDTDGAGNLTGIIANGVSTAENAQCTIEIPDGSVYSNMILSGCPIPSNVNVKMLLEMKAHPYTQYASDTGSGATIGSIPSGTTCYLILRFPNSGTTVRNVAFRPMIRRDSDIDPTFVPYTNIRPIMEWTGARVTNCGKNLLDPATLIAGDYNGTSIAVRVSQAFADRKRLTKGTTYYASIDFTDNLRRFWLIATDKNNVIIQYIAVGANAPVTFTAQNDGWLCFIFGKYTDDSCTVWGEVTPDEARTWKPMLAVGTEQPYIPYTGKTVAFSFNSAGPLYGGTLDVTRGLLTVAHKKVTFTGNESWNIMTNSDAYVSFSTNLSDIVYIPADGSAFGDIICSHYELSNANQQSRRNVDRSVAQIGSNIRIRDISLADMTVAEFKTWLNRHNIDIVYPLAEPIIYQLTPQQLITLAGTNNVFSDCGPVTVTHWPNDGIPMEPVNDSSNISYIKIVSEEISNLKTEINNLKTTIVNMGGNVQN